MWAANHITLCENVAGHVRTGGETTQAHAATKLVPHDRSPHPHPRFRTAAHARLDLHRGECFARRGKIVLILDDVGFEHQPVDAATRIDPNINFSVLPNAARATEVATLLHERGFEVLCHLPMEPEHFPQVSPGSGAVLTTMSDDEIARTTLRNVEAVPYARGVNNHMGSRATADRRVMENVLAALPEDMYFIDSRTTSASVAASVAKELSVRAASRNVFLDDVPTDAAVRQQLRSLAREAAHHGIAIGIGHMYPATIRVLTAGVPELRREGFRFIRASQAVR
ncbi:MAG: hypothetical protein DMF58_17810 [Acidobacteria bacterium]|nr:MAG: hypothetical protein DMF58_17810 [Acidobacteriota bacterium]